MFSGALECVSNSRLKGSEMNPMCMLFESHFTVKSKTRKGHNHDICYLNVLSLEPGRSQLPVMLEKESRLFVKAHSALRG